MSYNPIPPRVWSRVQNQCTYTDASGNFDINYNQVYIPLTKQTVTQAQANYEDKMIYKGNVLQYKGNSSRLTKSQKYTQLAKGFGPNRTKVFATQSQTYTNPNTTGLRRRNTQTYPYPNSIVGDPNNPSGPFQYNVPNPNGCSGVSIQDGGTLVCGTFANPCTGEIIKQGATSATICNPASASDVPGSSILCWNTQVQTWFPKPRYFMNNSTDKWPVNYKGLDGFSGLVSAVTPDAPVLTLKYCNTPVTLSWTDISSNCIPISSYNIYQDGILVQTVPYTIKSATITGLVVGVTYSFYITSVSNKIESLPSNKILYNNTLPFTASGTFSYTVDTNCNYTVTFTGSGTIIFNSNIQVNYTVTGGGGKGGDGPNGGPTVSASGGGGGGGGGTNIGNFTPTSGTLYTITVGGSTQSSLISSIITSNFGSNGTNGVLPPGGTVAGGAGGTGGAGTNSGGPGSNGDSNSSIFGGAGGSGGSGFNGYGNGGAGGSGGGVNFDPPGQQGTPGNHGVVILTFNA